MPKNSRILITGASGFLGTYIIKALQLQGYSHITGLTRNLAVLNKNNYPEITWVEGNILDMPLMLELVEKADIIINSAAEVSFSIKHKKRLLKIAVDGTANLVNAALDKGVQKFIHVSSVAAIGRRKPDETITEDMIFSHSKYDTTYGLSKFLAEQEVWRAHAEGLNVTIFNPSMILGAGDWEKSTAQLWKKIYHGLAWFGTGTTGWVAATDVSDIIVQSIQMETNGERYILSAENKSYKEVFASIAKTLDKRPPTKPLIGFAAKAMAFVEFIRSALTNSTPIITKETIESTSVNSRYDNEKSKQTFGIQYKDIYQTIKETSTQFLDHVHREMM
ncbi:MAG: NAD-dependent epimerase/dehydratase family protein [Saprospiraceae bacterium]|nr:NAD-dependent epimerase/dehydratase family protein [Saprospiraceae bacterium]